MWMIPFWTHIEVPMKCPQQVYQLRQQVEEALSDLNRAIELSGGRGKAAEQALTQRGIIWRVKGEDEKALEDFKKAGKLGNKFAQQQGDNSQTN
jgi:tetratricopeptide (TPR) repeat protein